MKTENKKCLECGNDLGISINCTEKLYFCGIECACYSGTFSMRTGWNKDKLELLLRSVETANPHKVSQVEFEPLSNNQMS